MAKLEAGAGVRSVDNPGREGVITNAPPRQKPSGRYFQIRWADGGTDFLHEDELEALAGSEQQDPYVLVEKGRYGRSVDLRRNLTYVHLSGRLANLVYSMGITSTDFYPHQYRPLLTLLDSPATGLLIADEVGLGKTIEAGLIWTEFRARFDMRRLVVICPAVLREKWKEELRNRFGVEASLVDAAGLLDALRQPVNQLSEGRAWIISYQAARPPKAWRADAKADNRPRGARIELADFLRGQAGEEAIVDLVVFDEAHYMRNSETAAWKLGELLRDVASYKVMLSATPINLHNEDLFNLLNLLDPDHFESQYDFVRLIEANQPLVAARDAALRFGTPAVEIIKHLNAAAMQPLLRGSLQLRALLEDLPTDERLVSKSYRAELSESLERINLISHIVTRTRKRDMQLQRVHREVRREAVPMSPAERSFYDAVTKATREYAWKNGISDGFLLATPQRQVTSCPAATAQAWLAGGIAIEEAAADLAAEYEDDSDDDTSSTSLLDVLRAMVPRSVDLKELIRNDTKFTRLMQVSGTFLKENPAEKIILFTSFRATARYLSERLSDEGLPARLLWGGLAESKQEVIDEFRKSKTLRVLVSTEVASEGVDLQFCRVLVNYDLPWNPTRIEQRIGRIDRLGQKAPLIHIWNLYFEGSIDERVVTRLLERLRVFEEALGEAEAAVGDAVRKLESALFNRPLTREEEDARIEQTAQALENLRLHREELDRNAAHMMAHGQRIIEKIEAAQELARRVTENDLLVYVQDYLARHWAGHRFSQQGADLHLINIQLPAELAAKLDDFMKAEGLLGRSLLASGQSRQCRFLNKISEPAKRNEEIVHQLHPLVRYISRDLKARNEHYFPLVAVRVRRGDVVSSGDYAIFIRVWVFHGVREEEILATCALEVQSGEALPEDISDQLVQSARLEGIDVPGIAAEIDASLLKDRFDKAEGILDARYRATFESKRRENADRAMFQLHSIQRHLDRRLPRLRETLHSHIAAGRASIARATQGQIDKLSERMNTRRARISDKEKVVADRQFICAGVIRVD